MAVRGGEAGRRWSKLKELLTVAAPGPDGDAARDR